LSDDQVRAAHAAEPILFRDGEPVPTRAAGVVRWAVPRSRSPRRRAYGRVGHSTRDSAPLLDLTAGAEVDPGPFWDPVYREDGDRLVLSPKRFYLLMSHEAVSIPPYLAAEMTAYDPTSGELRTHYAGFFDPGFGFDPNRKFQGLTGRTGGAGSRCAVHGGERTGGL
jgi:dCTP deaminase